MTDHFTAIPRRFTDAHIADELDALHVLVGLHVAARCYEVRNTSDGVAAIRLSTLAELCEVSNETVRRKLDDLREQGWLDFKKPDPGQHVAWRIWLIGLALEDPDLLSSSTRAPHELHTEPPPARSSSSTASPTEEAATPHGQRDRTSSQAPHVVLGEPTNETRRDEKTTTNPNPSSKEELDNALGKTTRGDRNGVDGDRLMSDAESRKMDAELRKMAQAETRRRHNASENERRFLAECQELVDAGEASWVHEDDDGRD